MAVNTGQRRETAYRNHVYVQGNTARRLQVVPRQEQMPVKSQRQDPQEQGTGKAYEYCHRAFHGGSYGGSSFHTDMVSDPPVRHYQQHKAYFSAGKPAQ